MSLPICGPRHTQRCKSTQKNLWRWIPTRYFKNIRYILLFFYLDLVHSKRTEFRDIPDWYKQTHYNSVIFPKPVSGDDKYIRIIRNSKTLNHCFVLHKNFFENLAHRSFGSRAKVLETGLTFFWTFLVSSKNATTFGVQSDIIDLNSAWRIIESRKKCWHVFLHYQKILEGLECELW